MAYVIAEPCIGEKNTACVDVCPVNCIHSDGGSQYYINPDQCIDCGACAPACPTDAIFLRQKLPKKWKQFAEINANFYRGGEEDSPQTAPWPSPAPQPAS